MLMRDTAKEFEQTPGALHPSRGILSAMSAPSPALEMSTPPTSAPGSHAPRFAILGSRGIPARYGGFETFVDELARRLVQRGVQVTVFCEADGEPKLKQYEGVELVHVQARAPGPARTIAFDIACLWQARKGFDVVYMLGYGASPACVIPRLFGTPVWINMDGLEWLRPKWSPLARLWLKTMEGLALRSANRVIFDNQALADEIQGRRHAVKHFSVLEYGAPLLSERTSPASLANWDVSSGEYYLVVCRFEPDNHVLEIVSAFARAKPTRPLLVVANKDVDTPYVKRTMALASNKIRFVGTIYDQDQLLPLRQHCRAYLHGHSVGGTNPSLLEAMGSGNFTLAHDNPFNRETLGESALFFTDEDELVQRLQQTEELAENVLEAKRKQASDRIAKHYTWDKITERYHDLLLATVNAG
ncbi:MAG: glycosyltransferase involved in cell wall biosynthesis [Candidatus Paceibacteria bacterium]|jgi:glycosyltransferase involved in cell wall biosynthesis